MTDFCRAAHTRTVDLDHADKNGVIPTEVIDCPPHRVWASEANIQDDEDPLDVIYVCIPGNPGCIGVYASFISAVYSSLVAKLPGSHVGAIGVSFAGHGMSRLHGKSVFNLEQQIAYLADVFRALAARHPSAKFIVSGHSVGAFIALRLLRDCPIFSARVTRIVMLFPTVHSIGSSPNGLSKRFFFRPGVRHVLAAVAGVVKTILGVSLLQRIVGTFTSTGPRSDVAHSIARFASYGAVLNCLTMAHHEMAEILVFDGETAADNEHRIIYHWGIDDQWAPLHFLDAVSDAVPNAMINVDEPGVPHAFVLSHGTHVAASVARYVVESLAPAAAAPVRSETTFATAKAVPTAHRATSPSPRARQAKDCRSGSPKSVAPSARATSRGLRSSQARTRSAGRSSSGGSKKRSSSKQ